MHAYIRMCIHYIRTQSYMHACMHECTYKPKRVKLCETGPPFEISALLQYTVCLTEFSFGRTSLLANKPLSKRCTLFLPCTH